MSNSNSQQTQVISVNKYKPFNTVVVDLVVVGFVVVVGDTVVVAFFVVLLVVVGGEAVVVGIVVASFSVESLGVVLRGGEVFVVSLGSVGSL